MRSGKFLGCDQQYFFEGEYAVSAEGHLTGKVHVQHYAGKARSIFYQNENIELVEYWADLEGKSVNGKLLLTAQVINHDGLSFQIDMSRVIPMPSVKYRVKFPPPYHLKLPPLGYSSVRWGSARGRIPPRPFA